MTKRKKSPTNTDLLLAIEKMRNEDREEMNRRLRSQDDKILGLASSDSVQAVHTLIEATNNAIFDEGELKLATKKDVQPVIDLYNKLALAGQISGGVGKWSSRATIAIAAFLIAAGVISGALRDGLMHLLNWAAGGR